MTNCEHGMAHWAGDHCTLCVQKARIEALEAENKRALAWITKAEDMLDLRGQRIRELEQKLHVKARIEDAEIKFVLEGLNQLIIGRDELLRDCASAIEAAIYSEDGLDGDDGQKLLKTIEKVVTRKSGMPGRIESLFSYPPNDKEKP